MSEVAENLARVRARMAQAMERAGRRPGEVGLVAVSKTKPVELIREAVAAGQLDFGENYAQELRDKRSALGETVRWHFIGHLQKNKVKYVVGHVYRVHSLDSLELAREMEKRASQVGQPVKALVEVNLAGESSKTGVRGEEARELVRAVQELKYVEVCGLMTMPPYFPDPEEARPYYRELKLLRDQLREELADPGALPELSMGMSHDFEVAIEEGATWVRVGTAIFGERNGG